MIGAPASASSAACRAAAAARAASGSVAGPAGVSGAGGAGVVSGWRAARASTRLRTSNGTIVATACGMLLITPAILSAVRSCSSRPTNWGVAAPGQDRGHAHARHRRLGVDQGGRGAGQPPVRAVDEVQHDPGVAPHPVLAQPVGLDVVDDEVDGPQRRRPQAAGVAQAGDGGQVVVVDETRTPCAGSRSVARPRAGPSSGAGCRCPPGPTPPARTAGFSQISPGTPSANRMTTSQAPSLNFTMVKMMTTMSEVSPAAKRDDLLVPPVRPLVAAEEAGHAEPGQRERREHADGVERHQPVDVGAREGQQRAGQDGQHDDAVGEHQPVPALGEPPGQEGVLGHEAGQETGSR